MFFGLQQGVIYLTKSVILCLEQGMIHSTIEIIFNSVHATEKESEIHISMFSRNINFLFATFVFSELSPH